jgi:hypothetical protein
MADGGWQMADGRSAVAAEEVIGQGVQRSGARAQRLECGEGASGQLLGDLPGFLKSDDGGVGGFVSGGIFAGGFPQLLARLSDIQDVVDDLEREADVVTEVGEGAELGGCAIGAHAAEPDGAAEQGGGLAFVNITKLRDGDVASFAFEVGHLAGDELEGTGGPGEFEDDVAVGISGPGPALGGDLEGLGEQGIAGEDGDPFTEDLVVGEASASIIVVIHGRQVVVDEGVGVDAFHGASQGHGVGRGPPAGLGGGQAEDGAETFSAGEQGIPHGFVNRGRARIGAGQEPVQSAVDGVAVSREVAIERERAWRLASVRHARFLGKGA